IEPTEARNGGQVQLPKTSTTGLPRRSDSLVVTLPSTSLRVKSGAASPTLRSPGRGRGGSAGRAGARPASRRAPHHQRKDMGGLPGTGNGGWASGGVNPAFF